MHTIPSVNTGKGQKTRDRSGRSRTDGEIKRNKDKYRELREINVNICKDYVSNYKMKTGCKDCGYSGNPVALDLDHIPGLGKKGNIAELCTYGCLETIISEISKCEVVCANCHRIRTHERVKIFSKSINKIPGELPPPLPPVYGEKHYRAKLTDDKVREIRRKYGEGVRKARELSSEYSITISNVYAIIHNRTWKHVC